jgi:hypothetical protein
MNLTDMLNRLGSEPRDARAVAFSEAVARGWGDRWSSLDASGLIATLMWERLIENDALPARVRIATAEWPTDFIVVPYGSALEPAFGLLILTSNPDVREPVGIRVTARPQELETHWSSWQRSQRREAKRSYAAENELGRGPTFVGSPSVVLAMRGVAQRVASLAHGLITSCVIARRPQIIATGIPNGPWGIGPSPTDPPESTAGVVCASENGELGVTAALHAVTPFSAQAGAPHAFVHRRSGWVERTHPLTDSAWIRLNQPPSSTDWSQGRGIMSGTTPRPFEKATFCGAASGTKTTTITGWSADLLELSGHNQPKVYTDASTSPGDSGAALLDSTGHVVGFASFRSVPRAFLDHAVWMWADCVMRHLRVRFA